MRSFVHVLFIGALLSLVPGKESNIQILSAEECSNLTELGSKLNWSLTQENQLSLTAEVEEIWDMEALGCEISIFGRNQEEVYEKLITIDGIICGYVTLILESQWDDVRSAIEPPIKKLCVIEPGTYELANFMVNPQNTKLPKILPKGLIKLELTANREGHALKCIRVELEVK